MNEKKQQGQNLKSRLINSKVWKNKFGLKGQISFQSFWGLPSRENIVRWICEVGVLLALFVVLKLLALSYSILLWPNGGTLGISFLVVIIMYFRWGLAPAALVKVVGTILAPSLIGKLIAVSPWQFLLDYFGAAAVGVPIGALVIWGFKIKKQVAQVVVLTLFAFIFGWGAQVFSGVFYFGSDASANQNVWIYSLVYNTPYNLGSYLLSGIIGVSLTVRSDRLFAQPTAMMH